MQPKRIGLIALLGIISMSLAACGDPAPAAPTSTSSISPTVTLQPATGSESTPLSSLPVATEVSTPEPVAGAVSPTSVAQSTATPERALQAAVCKLNLNDVSEEDLLSTIPGFSSRMVREFLEYRPYVSIQQFRREIGKYVDDAQIAEYEQYVYVPIDLNNSDAATLQQLPGVDLTLAGELIAARPYASSAAFLQSLSARVSEQQLSEARCFLEENS